MIFSAESFADDLVKVTPIIFGLATLALSCLGLKIAYGQRKIQTLAVKAQLFDLRYRLFLEIRDFVLLVSHHSPHLTSFDWTEKTAQANWLFGYQFASKYFQESLLHCVKELRKIEHESIYVDSDPSEIEPKYSDEQRAYEALLRKSETTLRTQVLDDFHELAMPYFEKYLNLSSD